jgi:hypothetical protein
MSSHSKSHRIAAGLVLAVGLILACGLGTGSSGSAPGVDTTTVALQLQGTAMSLQLTQAAVNPQPQAQPSVGVTAVAPVIPLSPAAIEITYGQTLASFPRKTEGILYGFQGTKDDEVTIVAVTSNARPQFAKCDNTIGVPSFVLRTPTGEYSATNETPWVSALRNFQLPASGPYYIALTCTGNGCNALCIEADVTLQKQ